MWNDNQIDNIKENIKDIFKDMFMKNLKDYSKYNIEAIVLWPHYK